MYIYVDFIDMLRRYVEISPFFRHVPRLMPHSSRSEEQLPECGVAVDRLRRTLKEPGPGYPIGWKRAHKCAVSNSKEVRDERRRQV